MVDVCNKIGCSMNAHRLSIPEAEIRGDGRYHFHTGIMVHFLNDFFLGHQIKTGLFPHLTDTL